MFSLYLPYNQESTSLLNYWYYQCPREHPPLYIDTSFFSDWGIWSHRHSIDYNFCYGAPAPTGAPLQYLKAFNIKQYSLNYVLLFVVHVCKFESNGLNICWKLELFVCRDVRHVKHEKKQSCRGLKCWKQVSQTPSNWGDSVLIWVSESRSRSHYTVSTYSAVDSTDCSVSEYYVNK